MRRLLAATAILAASVVGVGTGAGPADAATHGCPQYRRTAYAAGFTAQQFNRISPILWRESRCSPTAINQRTHDYGVAQIHCAGRANWCARLGISPAGMLNVFTNLRAARLILRLQGWGAWG